MPPVVSRQFTARRQGVPYHHGSAVALGRITSISCGYSRRKSGRRAVVNKFMGRLRCQYHAGPPGNVVLKNNGGASLQFMTASGVESRHARLLRTAWRKWTGVKPDHASRIEARPIRAYRPYDKGHSRSSARPRGPQFQPAAESVASVAHEVLPVCHLSGPVFPRAERGRAFFRGRHD